jgi:hypothetical protein
MYYHISSHGLAFLSNYECKKLFRLGPSTADLVVFEDEEDSTLFLNTALNNNI